MSRTNLLGSDRVNTIDLVTTDPSAPRPQGQKRESAGFLDAFPTAWRENALSELANVFVSSRDAFAPDPGWNPKRSDIDAVTENVDQDLWYKYENAVSADHLYSIYIDNLSKMERRDTMQRAGWSGTFARLAAELPEQAIIALLSGGAGNAGVAATRAARLASYAKYGLMTGAPTAAMEGFRASVNPDIKARDVLIAGLSGAGGAIGGKVGNKLGAGFLRTGLGVGIGSAAPVAGVGLLTGQDRNELALGAGTAFLVGGVFGGLGGIGAARAKAGTEAFAAAQAAERAQMDKSIREALDRATLVDAITGVLGYRPSAPKSLTEMPLASMSYASLDDITSPGGFATLKEYYGKPKDPRLALLSGRLGEFADTIAPGDAAEARLLAIAADQADVQAGANSRYLPFGETLDPTLAQRRDANARLSEFAGILDQSKSPSTEPAPLQFGRIEQPNPPQVLRRQSAIDALSKLDATERARIDAVDRLFPGAEELQAQALAASDARVANKRAVTDGRKVDIVDANDIDPLFAESLGLTVDELKATMDANFTRKAAQEFGYTFSRKRMEAKRTATLEMVEALDDDLPPGVEVVTPEAVAVAAKNNFGRLEAATAALSEAASPPAPAMGAASANDPAFIGDRTRLPNAQAGMFLVDTIGDEVPWNASVRKYTSARAMNVVGSSSINPTARIAANVLAFDQIPRVNARTGEIIGIRQAGGKWKTGHSAGMNNEYQAALLNAYDIHKKGGGTLSEAEFNVTAAKAKRRQGKPNYAEYESIPGIKEAVAVQDRNAYDPSATVMERHGIEGAEISRNPNFVPREWQQWAMRQAEKKVGDAELLNALAKAYQIANPDDPPEIAALVARYIRKNGGRHEYRHPGLDMLDGELEVVLKTMTDQGEKDALVKLFKERVQARRAQKDRPTTLRNRIDLDETYVHEVIQNGQKVSVAIEDLLENNAAVLGKKHIDRAHGSVVHKELMRRLSEPGMELRTLDELKALIQKRGKEAGQTDFQIEWDIHRIESLYRDAVGIPRVTDPAFLPIARVGRMLRSALRSTLLSTHYYTVTNAGEPITHLVTDVKTAASSLVPAVSELTERAIDGKLSNKNARMFEFMTGRGGSWLSERNHIIEQPASGFDAALAKAENFVNDVGRFGSRLVGAEQTQDYFFRVIGDESQHRVAEWILSGKRPNAALLREFGWTDAQFDMIAEAARPHIETVKGPTGGAKIHVLNQDKWSPEAFATFEAGLWSMLDGAFTNPGSEARSWLSNHELGRFLFQFRDFGIFASDAKWAKAAFAFQEGDKATASARTATRFMANVMYSYAAYTMLVYLKSLGRPDAEQYREERLGNGKAWTVAVGRTSYASVIPAATDAALSAVGVDPAFAPGRASGIKGGGVTSTAVGDYIGNSLPALGRLARRPFVEDEDLSVQDVMAATRGVPFFFQYEPLTKGVEYFARNVMKLPEKPKQ